MRPDAITDSPRFRKPGETECWLAVGRSYRGGVMVLSKTRFETAAEAKAEAARILAEQKASRPLEAPYSGTGPLMADPGEDPYRAFAQTILREPGRSTSEPCAESKPKSEIESEGGDCD